MTQALTRRQELVLAALVTQPELGYAPVQVQKLFFLVDENVADPMGGKLFRFEPYNYGPFDPAVYAELNALQAAGLLSILGGGGGNRRYKLTSAGVSKGQVLLQGLPERVSSYFARASEWVTSLSFAQLVGAIYKAYPTMKENSIFVGK